MTEAAAAAQAAACRRGSSRWGGRAWVHPDAQVSAPADVCRVLAMLMSCPFGERGMQLACHVTGPLPATPTLPLAPACEATRGRGGCVTQSQRVSVWAWRRQLAVTWAGERSLRWPRVSVAVRDPSFG